MIFRMLKCSLTLETLHSRTNPRCWESDIVSPLYSLYTWFCSYYRKDILHCQRLKNSFRFKVHQNSFTWHLPTLPLSPFLRFLPLTFCPSCAGRAPVATSNKHVPIALILEVSGWVVWSSSFLVPYQNWLASPPSGSEQYNDHHYTASLSLSLLVSWPSRPTITSHSLRSISQHQASS